VRDQLHAKDFAGEFCGFFLRLGEFHAAALTASAGMYLRFNYDSGGAIVEQRLSRSVRLFHALDHVSARDRHSVLRQYGFALILVNFHDE
jgi:hypothetical protein